jgi:glycosyltransferase involved in cell wall biosynthesis
MKILLSSNAFYAPTGYGVQAKGIINKVLLPLGHEVVHHAWYGLEGGIIKAGDVKIYPKLHHPYGNDSDVVARSENVDLCITLQDVWVLDADFAQRLPCPWLGHFPIDGDPIPPKIDAQARQMAYPVVYSHHASQLMNEAGIKHAYMQQGIDTDVYSYGDRMAARQELEWPLDKTIITMVAANKGFPSRKSYPEALQAFKMYHDHNPNSILYLHTEKYPRGSGLNLIDVMRLVGLTDNEVKFVNQADYLIGMPEEYLAQVYRASDLLLAPSMGEGFGLPIAEAQSCGCPVITTDVTSMSELTINGTSCRPLQRTYSPLGHWQYTADVDEIYHAMWAWFEQDENTLREKSIDGSEYFKKYYSWDYVRDAFWYPLLDKIETDLGIKEAVTA